MIAVEKLCLSQGAFSLDGLDFELPGGVYGALVGRSGCGKTTLLEAICGLRPLRGGRILLGNRDVTQLRPGGRGVGYVPQDGALFPHLSVARQLGFGLEVRGKKQEEIESRIGDLAGKLGVSHLLERMPGSLSGGECQRVALGRALSLRPKYLCLDEPLSALDVQSRDEIIDLLGQAVKGTGVTVLQVTHDERVTEGLAEVVLRLSDGKVIRES